MQDSTEMTGPNIIQKINSFAVWVVLKIGYQFIWIALNRADRLSSSDTGEKQVVMRKQLQLMTIIMGQELIQVVKLKGLTMDKD